MLSADPEPGRHFGDRAGEAQALGNLGSAHYDTGEYNKAIEFYQQRLAIALEIGDPMSEGTCHIGLCLSFISLGDLDRAFSHSEECAKTFEGKEQARVALKSLARQK